MPAARTRSDASRSRRADRAAAPPESRYPIEDTAPEACPCPGGCATPVKPTAAGATRASDELRRTLTTDRFAEALFERFSAAHASTPFERHGGGQP